MLCIRDPRLRSVFAHVRKIQQLEMLILSVLMRGVCVCVHVRAKQTMLCNFKHTQTLPQLRTENENNVSFPREKEKIMELRVPCLPWKKSIHKKTDSSAFSYNKHTWKATQTA